MEGEVLRHGELVEFRSRLKCEACQRGDHTCIIQSNTGRCISCDGAGVECIFTRTLILRGPKDRFPWEWLLNDIPTRSLKEGFKRISSESPQPLQPHRTPRNLEKVWRKAFLICRAINRFRGVNRYKKDVNNKAFNHESIITQDLKHYLPCISSIQGSLKSGSPFSQVGYTAPDYRVLPPKNSYGSKVIEADQAPSSFGVFEVESMEEVFPRSRRLLTQNNKNVLLGKGRTSACALCKHSKRKVRLLCDRHFEVY